MCIRDRISAVETLVKSDFKPKRTIILSIGHDEESDGKHGAQHLSAELEKRFGRGGIGMIVDEGTPLLSSADLAMVFLSPCQLWLSVAL